MSQRDLRDDEAIGTEKDRKGRVQTRLTNVSIEVKRKDGQLQQKVGLERKEKTGAVER